MLCFPWSQRHLTRRRLLSVELSRKVTPPTGLQVGSRTGARTVGGGFPAERLRLRGGCTVPPWPRFQLPPRQTPHADVPHGACLLPACQGVWDRSRWERLPPSRLATRAPGGRAASSPVVQPPSLPPLPAAAPTVPGTPQRAPHLLFPPSRPEPTPRRASARAPEGAQP